MAKLIQTRKHNQYIDVLQCGMLKWNEMIKRYDQYSDVFMERAAEVQNP